MELSPEGRRALLLLADALGFDIETDNDGQLVIYSGMTLPEITSGVQTLDDAVEMPS